ncbi:MAG: hypothetical protein OEY14_12250, partial [Myxococcales bacterium]|nr:hypothetical protein [Myxococcales bacterium]
MPDELGRSALGEDAGRAERVARVEPEAAAALAALPEGDVARAGERLEAEGLLGPGASAPAGDASALEALPMAERLGLERALAAGQARYAPQVVPGGVRLRAGGALAILTGAGARVGLGEAVEAQLRISAIGRSGRELTPLGEASAVEVRGPEAELVRGAGLREWWRALPSGLEHGLDVQERPANAGRLEVQVTLGDDLVAEPLDDQGVALMTAEGRRVATYAHLRVVDAAGESLPARMEARGSVVALLIDDAAAHYPLVVDPLLVATEEATFFASDGAAWDLFGASVSLSADGSRALVGANADDTAGGVDAGSARVYLRSGTTWTEEATLFASDGAAGDGFGVSVSLSADGSRALVGAYRDDTPGGSEAGSARVYLRSGTTWTEEATLFASDGALGDRLGVSVSLSEDGSRALVGASLDDTPGGPDAGSARVFVRSGTSWSEEATLLASDGALGDRLGRSVSLSGDGSLALVGAYGDDTAGGADAGSARVYSRSGTTWTEEATLFASDGAAWDSFGYSVSLSGDGSRALVGAYQDDTAGGADAGSARVYSRSGTTWTEEATLFASDGVAQDYFGVSVSLSGDGSRVLIGAHADDTAGGSNAGSARVYSRSGTTWSEDATLLASDGAATDYFGISVSLSGDGNRALVGAYGDDTPGAADAGGARVFSLASTGGAACADAGSCASGFCVDGVCCDGACGGGSGTDCEACTAALTGDADGACAPLSGAVAPTITCRAAIDVCDAAETCTSGSSACPADAYVTPGIECRAAAGVCDVAESCSGVDTACPADAYVTPGIECRAAAGLCDVAESCTGVDTACPADAYVTPGIECRAAAGLCDVAESCSGVDTACPADAYVAPGIECRAAAGVCG